MSYWDLVPASAVYRRPLRTPGRELLNLGWWGANALAPNLTGLLSGQPAPPLPNVPEMTRSGKIPSTNDPRVGPAWAETASLLSNFIPLGGPMTGVGAMAVPMAAKVARRTALPMDTAARMARATEGGFYTQYPLAHGTASAFNAFDAARKGATTGAAPARMGVWSEVRRPGQPAAIADEFAEMAARTTGGNPQSYPLLHRAEKPASITLTGDELNHEIAATLDCLWSKGHDAVMLKNYTSPGGRSGDILVVIDPAQLRSPFAKFDPAKRNSANLLAGVTGAGILPPIFGTVDPAALPISDQSASEPSP